jgi:CHAT domain-containing protein/tetratricopeptide (TPR) repeat protein
MRPAVLALLALLVAPAAAAQPAPERLVKGTPVTGALTAETDTLESGEHFTGYPFERADDGPFEVRLTSTAFDPYLVVVAPDGTQLSSDDWAGSSEEARILVDAGMPGTWEAFVTSDARGATGAFTLVHLAATEETRTQIAGLEADLERSYALTEEVFSLYAEGRYAEATAAAREALALRERALGQGHPDTAELLNNLALLLEAQGDYDAAGPLYERALALLEADLGPDHPDVAVGLNNLAGLLFAQGDYDAARRLHERALAIREAALGPDDPETASSLSNLALLLEAQGDYDAARPLQERALAINEAALGPDHPDVATVLDNLAGMHEDQGDYAAARRLHERALAIREAALGPGHPDVAVSLNNLAELLKAQGDYDAARPLYERALAVSEAALGPDHPTVATALNNLAILLQEQGDFAAARGRFERALAIREATLGSAHPDVAVGLGNLARLHYVEGDYPTARSLFERALVVSEAAFGRRHPAVATGLNNLAFVLRAQEDYAGAQAAFERAIAAYEAVYGPDHRAIAAGLSNLVFALDARGDHAAVPPLVLRAARIYDGLAEDVLPTLAAAEQRAFVALDLDSQTGYLLSAARLHPAVLPEAYGLFGGWKGLLLRELRRQTALAALADDPTHTGDVARLQALRAHVARAYRSGDPALPELTREKEQLERRLAAALPPDAASDPWRTLGVEGLAAALPADAALADVYRYAHWEGGWFRAWRYAAVVTAHGAAPVLVDLGEAAPLEETVATWREAVTAGRTAEVETEALAEALWAPLGAVLPAGTARVWVSPDGELGRVPWATLAEAHDPTTRLLVAQVPSARDLLTLLAPEPERGAAPSLLLVGGVDFGDGAGFAPLPGTAQEVEALAALAESQDLAPTVLTGAAPTTAAVSAALPRATYAHLATHGFFYGERAADYEARGGEAPFARTDVLGAPSTGSPETNRNPLAESGLALAGANASPAGTLTAEELVGLDLSGTRLVVLSACETGRGTEVTGQGVLGLQASFTAAGARSLLMSLWRVPDASTAALMAHFYRGLWEAGLAPAEALRQAQAAVRATPGWEAPVHWAAWVLSGTGW